MCGSARFDWKPDDPEIVSDVLFAVANVLSIARTTYLMPAFEVLGPLQISLGRMIGDITRFLVLFTLVRCLPSFIIVIMIIRTSCGGLNSDRLQEEKVPSESIMDFNNTKGFLFVGCDMGGSYGSNKGSLRLEKLYCPMCFYSTRKD